MSERNGDLAASPRRGRLTIVYLIHEAFRRDLDRLSSAVRAPRLEVGRAGRLGAHWRFVNEQLHHHHHVEDESLWPLLRPKLAGQEADLAVLDEMAAQHQTLEPTCRAVDEGFDSLASGPSVGAGEELAGRLEALRTLIAAHLDDEESKCFPVIEKTPSNDEFQSFGKATAKAVGMRGSARFFPWIFDGAQAAEHDAVLSMPPPPVRVLCRYVWEPRYKRHVAPLWTS